MSHRARLEWFFCKFLCQNYFGWIGIPSNRWSFPGSTRLVQWKLFNIPHMDNDWCCSSKLSLFTEPGLISIRGQALDSIHHFALYHSWSCKNFQCFELLSPEICIITNNTKYRESMILRPCLGNVMVECHADLIPIWIEYLWIEICPVNSPRLFKLRSVSLSRKDSQIKSPKVQLS